MLLGMIKCIRISVFSLGMRLEGNALKNGEPTVGFSFTDTLHYTTLHYTTLHYTTLYQSVSVKDFLANKNVKTLEHSTHSPDLVPADIYLFPGLKLALKRRPFCDASTLIKNMTEELKRFSQNSF
jgi:hypothetical protein